MKKNAYMTLEATMIFPMIFGGILFAISLAIYLYNASIIKQICSVAALRGSLEYQMNEEEMKKFVNKEIDTLIKERMLLVAEIEKDIKITESKVEVRLRTKINLPFMGIPFLDFKWQKLEVESQAKRIKAVKIIRDARRLYGG